MNNYSNHKGKSDCHEAESRRFSAAYKQAMQSVTVSPELRERILRLQDKKIQPYWIKVVKTTACAAACLTIVLAARSWLTTESRDLSISSNSAGASTAVYSLSGGSAAPDSSESNGAASSQESGAAFAAASSEQTAPAETDGVLSEEAAQQTETTADPREATSSTSSQPSEDVSSSTASRNNQTHTAQTGNPDESASQGTSSQASDIDSVPQTIDEMAPMNDQPDGENSSTSQTTTQVSGNSTQLANPMVPCSSVQEAEATLGWSISAPDLSQASLTLINGSLFEASWEDGRYYRMARTSTWGTDISGDYNTYDCELQVTIGQISLTMKGNAEDAYTLLTWVDDGFSYAWSSNTGMTRADAEAFVQSILTTP